MTNPKTKNLELNLIDRTSPTTTYLNLQTNLDDNWEKIDQALGSETVDAEPIPVTLKQGMQVVNNETNRKVPLQLKSLKGRTLVNLLGRDGGCESIAPFATGGAMTLTLDASNKTTGSYGIKATNVTPTGTFWRGSIPIKAGKYYITLADLKNGTADNIFVRFPKSQISTPAVTDNSKFQTVFVKYAATVDDIGLFDCVVTGDAGEYAYVDSIRIYEISQAEYNALDSMTADQIAAKYPYVDDMKPIVNPYVIRYGKNLLPPFTEWYGFLGGDARFSYPVGKYKFKMEPRQEGTEPFISNYRFTVPIIPGETYTYSCTHNGKIGVNLFTADMVRITDHGLPNIDKWLTDQSITFTAPLNARYANILIGNNDISTVGCEFSNPMFNIGTEPLPFVPREDNMQVAVTRLASSVNGSVYDEIYQKEGRLYKFGRFKTIDLDGSLYWELSQVEGAGFKRARIPSFVTLLGADGRGYQQVIKYNGKPLMLKGSVNGPDEFFLSYADPHFYITIPNADSGWGDSYRPSNDEIKAYFYGWKMYPVGDSSGVSLYNGEGAKAWAKRRVDGTFYDGTDTLPRDTYSDFLINFGYYKLQYQLATPTLEEVSSEGQISLHEGINQVEVGAGMIVREKAKPVQDSMNPSVYINVDGNKYSNVKGSELSFRTERILNIFDETFISKFSITHNTPNAYGNDFAIIPAGLFDNSKPYSVTYTALDKYLLTGPVTAIDCQYPSNMKTIVNDLVSCQVDVVQRVGVLEMQKANKYQPQWITPTLLNGWENYGFSYSQAGYYKDDMGLVHIRGLIKSGVTEAPAFILPKGYRPRFTTVFVGISSSGAYEFAYIRVNSGGLVTIVKGGNVYLSLDGISFLAEQ